MYADSSKQTIVTLKYSIRNRVWTAVVDDIDSIVDVLADDDDVPELVDDVDSDVPARRLRMSMTIVRNIKCSRSS